MPTTTPWVWHGEMQRAVYRGEVDVTTTTITASLHLSTYVPDDDEHLLLTEATNEVAVASYSRKTLTNVKLAAASAGKRRLTFDPVIWAGLNTAGGLVDTVVYSLPDGRILAHQKVVDENTGTGPVAPAGGGLTVRAYDPDDQPPPPGGNVPYAAGTAAEALGWGYPPPQSAAKTAALAALTGHTLVRSNHIFCHTGLKTSRSGWPATVRDSLGLGSKPFVGGTRQETVYMTIPPMERADRQAGETQTSIRQTQDHVLAGENDDYFDAVAGYIKQFVDANGYKWPNGLPKLACQFGQEWNLTFPWKVSDDPVKAGKIWNRFAQALVNAGVNITKDGVPCFVNVNTIGLSPWADVVTFFNNCTLASGFTVDSYLVDYAGKMWAARGTTATTGITSGRGNERQWTAYVQSARLGNKNPALEIHDKVSGWKVVRECIRRGLMYGIDEWAVATTTIPLGDPGIWGSGDDPEGVTSFKTHIEEVIPVCPVFHASYFEYDVSNVDGKDHRIKSPVHPLSLARFKSDFAAD